MRKENEEFPKWVFCSELPGVDLSGIRLDRKGDSSKGIKHQLSEAGVLLGSSMQLSVVICCVVGGALRLRQRAEWQLW